MYRFTGREYDTAMGKYSNVILAEAQPRPKARERRLSARDPIFSLQSLYAYCNNSPANFTDPSGMHSDDWSAEYSTEECGMGVDAKDNDTSDSTYASAYIPLMSRNAEEGDKFIIRLPSGKLITAEYVDGSWTLRCFDGSRDANCPIYDINGKLIGFTDQSGTPHYPSQKQLASLYDLWDRQINMEEFFNTIGGDISDLSWWTHLDSDMIWVVVVLILIGLGCGI